MTDEGKKKPPRPPYVRPVEPPVEPFRNLIEQKATEQKTIADVLGVQRKMALQLDGFGQLVNRRFELFHQELAFQRADVSAAREAVDKLYALVTGDHAPRLDAVEGEVKKLTPKQKAKLAGVIAAKLGAGGGVVLLLIGPALRALAKLYPEYGELIEGILAAVGL